MREAADAVLKIPQDLRVFLVMFVMLQQHIQWHCVPVVAKVAKVAALLLSAATSTVLQ